MAIILVLLEVNILCQISRGLAGPGLGIQLVDGLSLA